ncbi:MAG TPA: SLC13 family permease [Gammaproteobacteria bacterium]|nr:SLC13 family permease [Gammaproteobacteria bacterium]
MSLAWISVAALVLAITLSCTTTINVGVLSLALALIVGVGLGNMSPGDVLDGFPVDLFTTLVGVTLLFAIADVNGTLARLTERAVRLCRGHAGALPLMFFAIGFVVATIGAGATPASALLAPPAMAVAARAGVPPLLRASMAGNGALAGTLSPFAPTGVVAHQNMEQIGLGGYEWVTFTYNALAHTLVGFGGFFLLGGWKLFRRGAARADAADVETVEPMNVQHWTTTAGIVALILAVVGFDAAGFDVNVGMVALIVVTVLVLLRTVDEAKAIARMPWGVILMVTGVTVLIALLRDTQGLQLIASGIARVSTPETIEPVVAFGVGIVSVYSSTSGVVLPAFLPMVPDLAAQLGGHELLPIAWSMNVSASLVDLSSLSTGGALFIAGAAGFADTRKLFNQLLAWGMSMAVVGAVLCYFLFG